MRADVGGGAGPVLVERARVGEDAGASASSVALKVPLFRNVEPAAKPPLVEMNSDAPLRFATPLFKSVRPELPALPKVLLDDVPLMLSVAPLLIVVVPELASVPPVQLNADVMFCEPVPPSVPLSKLNVPIVADGLL
jgi:hypothetical protein